MKQSAPDDGESNEVTSEGERLGVEDYVALVKRYGPALDLLSEGGLADIDRLADEGLAYGELIALLAPVVTEVLDVGSGAGLPGIPVALMLPHVHVHLVEKRRRRVSFLRIAVSQLGLANVAVHDGDVRDLRGTSKRVVTAQAVGTFADLYRLTAHLHAEEVWLLSRKGPGWQAEVRDLESCLGRAALEVREQGLGVHGRLGAVLLPGGLACPPSG